MYFIIFNRPKAHLKYTEQNAG